MILWQFGRIVTRLKPPREKSYVLDQYVRLFSTLSKGGDDILLKTCNKCGNLIPYGSAYCTKCTPIVEAERESCRQKSKRESDRRYNKSRDPKYVRFYNSAEWRVLSAKYSQDKGYRCERCKAMATQVHHKQAIQTPDGWERRLDYTNLELLCTACHNERHERFIKHTSRTNPGVK